MKCILLRAALVVGLSGLSFATSVAAAPTTAPSPQPPEIYPAKLRKAQQIIQLPAPADRVIAAGGGRYLVAQLKKVQSLAVIDLCDAKLAKLIALPSGENHFAAGLTHLFVAADDNRSITRYRLSDFGKELTVLQPERGVQSMEMGCASSGPLVIASGKRTLLYDPMTFASAPFQWDHWAGPSDNWPAPAMHVSGDGRTIVAWGGGWAGIEMTTVDGTSVVDHHDGGYLQGEPRVNFNGSLIFTNGGAFGADLHDAGLELDGYGFGAISPDYVVVLKTLNEGEKANKKNAQLKFYMGGGRQLIWSMDDAGDMAGSSLPPEQRIWFVPAARVVAAVMQGNDRVLLRQVDVVGELKKSGIDYLLVTSSPPANGERGKHYSYDVEVASKQGGAKCSLSSGPAGMTVSEEGHVDWDVPSEFDQSRAQVIISVSDASGQTTFQTFDIRFPKIAKPQPVKHTRPQPRGAEKV